MIGSMSSDPHHISSRQRENAGLTSIFIWFQRFKLLFNYSEEQTQLTSGDAECSQAAPLVEKGLLVVVAAPSDQHPPDEKLSPPADADLQGHEDLKLQTSH